MPAPALNSHTVVHQYTGAGEAETDMVVLALLEPAEFWAVNWKVIAPVPEVYIVILPDGCTGPYP